MATQGDNRTKGETARNGFTGSSPAKSGSFPGTSSDVWHRTLTGRQSPEPVSLRLRMIYGKVVSEQLPDHMLDLLSKLDKKAMDKG